MRSRRVVITLLAGCVVIAACSSSIGGQPTAAHAVFTAPSSTAPSPGPAITVPSSMPPAGAAQARGSADEPTDGAGPPGGTSGTITGSPSIETTPSPTTTRPGGGPDGAIGSVGIGDPYYPKSGNGGYEVDSYTIDLTYIPTSNVLSATTIVRATVTENQRLGRFDLDLQSSMKVSSVSVNGAAAAFTHPGTELVITPGVGLAPGARMTIAVVYSGRPTVIPGGAANLGDGGWYRTPSGGAVAIGEPFSGSAWYPVNEHPSDTASYQVTATVPAKWSVMSNGLPVTTGLPRPAAGMRVFRWAQKQPITSYEATIYIDTFTTVEDTTVDGKPIVSAFAPSPDVAKYKKLAADTRQILQVLTNHFGPYPFDAAGGIYTGQKLTFALETATRPVYADWVDTDTIVHELTHQWFGDDVVVKRWSDICLNECFASYGPWLWYQDVDQVNMDSFWVQTMAKVAANTQFWSSPLVDMGPGKEFTSVYTRGPLAIHALRKQMGEKDFAALLKGWPATYGGKAASWSEFVAYVNKVSGQNLTAFIGAWFAGKTVPPARFLHPGGLGR